LADVAALLVRATLLMGAAWAAAALLRRGGASAAARHMAWLSGIAALLALPVLWYLVPDLRLPVLPAEAASAVATATSPAAPASTHHFVTGAASGVAGRPGWGLVLLAAYVLGAAALLLRLVVGRRMLKRMWNDAGAARDKDWDDLLSRLSARLGLSRRVELRIAKGPAVPMTWGTLAPRLLLPAEACQWPPERRRLVLLHELAHVARRDSLSRSLASLACALYWFHPGAWLAARQMRMEQEHAADDHVLMAGGSPRAYASSLLQLAVGPGAGARFDQAAAMAGMYQLERRLLSITSPARRTRPGTLFRSAAALLAGATTFVVAAGVPVRASPALPGPFGASRTPAAPLPGKAAASGQAEASSGRHSRAPRSAPEGPGNEVPSTGGESAAASKAGQDSAEGGPPSLGDRAAGARVPTRSVEEGRGEGPQPVPTAQQLQDYGWELPRRDLQVRPGSGAASPQPARITLPARLYPESAERSGPPSWARNVPRLVRGRPPTGSPLSATQGPLVLSWSVEVGK
jgi:beta-lactamase regulating signal transducer with metallopeptidase domain